MYEGCGDICPLLAQSKLKICKLNHTFYCKENTAYKTLLKEEFCQEIISKTERVSPCTTQHTEYSNHFTK